MTTTVSQRNIPFFNYRQAFAEREDDYLEIIRDIIRRGAFIQQRDLADFEDALGRYLGVPYAIGVGNATDGLVIALKAAGVGSGHEVIFPSHTMVATAAAIAHVGATPVPVDCGPDHLMDPDSAARAVTPRTRAIMPVQLNGRTCAMNKIEAIAGEHDLLIIEDAAQGLGSRFGGKFAGTFGIAAAFSFYPAKILGCFGDGGAIVTGDADVARKARLLRDHGRNDSGDVELWGFNSRLDNLQAAILHAQFVDYDAIISRRRAIASLYDELLRNIRELVLPPAPGSDPDHFDVFQNYELEAERRDDLRAHLSKNGIGTIIQWGGKAVHQFKALGFTANLPATERLFERCLMLPLNMTVTDEEVRYISRAIRDFYSSGS
jgi:dTDP-4-amino-4,6-dideoxygalactose transaminase